MTIALTTTDVPYLPLPNRVEVVLSDQVCPIELTATAFMLPVFDDGSVLFSVHQRRGIEIAGGHVEPGESLVGAAVRECFEETGCDVHDIRPLGFLRMMLLGDVPEGYRYPHPVSYQQFFTGRVAALHPYTANEECAVPLRTHDLDCGFRPSLPIFGRAALDLFGFTNDQQNEEAA